MRGGAACLSTVERRRYRVALLMPSKRDVLAHLTRDELLAVADRFELPVADRRARDGLVEAVASSKKATLNELLPELPRDRLKAKVKEARMSVLLSGEVRVTPDDGEAAA